MLEAKTRRMFALFSKASGRFGRAVTRLGIEEGE
jgi:hypothetical protein